MSCCINGKTLSGILNEIRLSARSLVRNPSVTIALLFTIALGLGSNVTVRGFARGLTIHNSPLTAKDRVVSLFGRDRYRDTGPVSYEDYISLKSHLDGFDWIGAAQVSQCVVKLAGQSEIKSVATLTPSLARIFKLSMEGGGVVISRRVWLGEFRGEAHVRGESVRVGDIETRVVGVVPDGLQGIYNDRPIDLWRPLHEDTLSEGDRNIRNVWVLAGLRQKVSTDQMKNGVRRRLIGSIKINVVPYTGMTPDMEQGLARVGALLRVAAGFVFFIACVNLASFLLGRAATRSRDTSIRVALGVSRSLLARAVLVDSILISAAGGALGVILAAWTSKIIPALLFEQDAEFLVLAPGVFGVVLASAASVGIILMCGLLPLFGIRQDRPAAILAREVAGPSRTSRAVRAGLVIAQLASCCLLVIFTGLLYQGLREALRTRFAHRLGQPIVATVQVHPDVDVNLQYFRDVERAARSVSGTSNVTWAARLPGSQPAWRSFRIDPQGLPLRHIKLDIAAFTPRSVSQFTWPPRSGRMFGFRDQGCRVAIVNEQAADVLFGDGTVGRSLADSAGMPVEIIGVVSVRKIGGGIQREPPTLYYANANAPGTQFDRISMAGFSAPAASRLERAEFDTNVVSPNYFAAMGFALVGGKTFLDSPSARGCRVAVVNQEADDLYFGGHAVGAALIDDLGLRSEIIGVVHSTQFGVFERRAEPTVYFPMAQDCLYAMKVIIGARTASGPMLAQVRHTLHAVPGAGPTPLAVQTLEAYLNQTALAPLHIVTVIVSACASTALFLSILGLYGTLNDAARARRRDLAIRIALGARRRDLIYLILREGGRLAGAGTLLGMFASILPSQLLTRIASNIGAPNLWVWLAGPIVVGCAVAIAGVFPAWRALMVDPLRILHPDN